MINYSQQTVIKYICGLDVAPFEIEQLENDIHFMIEVLKVSKDYRMYDFASENLKRDYCFIRTAIELFKKNIPFVKKVANAYFESTDDKVTTLELSIILSEIIPKDDPDFITYGVKRAYNTIVTESTTELVKEKIEQNPFLKGEVGMGFLILKAEYGTSPIILDYFAKSMILRIFKENDLNVEVLLHKRFKTVEDLRRYGVTKFLLDIILSFDRDLGEYAAVHKNVISEYIDLVQRAIDRWDQYFKDLEKKRYTIMNERLMAFYQKNISRSYYSFDEMIELIGRELGILDKLILYKILLPAEERDEDYIDLDEPSYDEQGSYEDIDIDTPEEKIDKKDFNLTDTAFYLEIKKIILEVLYASLDEEDPFDDYIDEENKKKAGKVIGIIPFDTRKKIR